MEALRSIDCSNFVFCPKKLFLAPTLAVEQSFTRLRIESPSAAATMGLLSILPESWGTLETWLTRLFLFMGIVTIGPWVSLLAYDLVLYVCRKIAYEIPVWGGRAQGKARPRAPSLTERPSGHRRRFSLARGSQNVQNPPFRTDSPDLRSRHLKEETSEDF